MGNRVRTFIRQTSGINMRQLFLIFIAICCIAIPSTDAKCSLKIDVRCTSVFFDMKCNTKAHNKYPDIYGSYYSLASYVNGKAHYTGGNTAIWYKDDGWFIGNISSLGRREGFAYYRSTAECPSDTFYAWQYYSNGQFYDADKSLAIFYETRRRRSPRA